MNPSTPFPSKSLPPAVGLKVNEVCDHFEAAWRGGKRPRVEDFIRDTPEPVLSPLLLELVHLEMEYRRLHGEDSHWDEYRSRFPSLPFEPPVEGSDLSPLSRAGRFELLDLIGRGGMGLVYRAYDPDCRRHVAVKVMHERHKGEANLVRRFLEGAQLTGQLQHPGVPPVHEIGRLSDGRPFFTMKLVEGRTLADLLHSRRDCKEEMPRFLTIFTQVCQAVACAHSHGILHRDLKPANVMVGAFGEVQVMDWGLAKLVNSNRPEMPSSVPTAPMNLGETVDAQVPVTESQDGTIVGTPEYMPPEQARGQVLLVDRRSDVFGLGAILCEIVTGHPPYRGTDGVEVLVRAASADVGDALSRMEASGTDTELVHLGRTCLRADRDARPKDAEAVAMAMASYQLGVEERLRKAELERTAVTVRAREELKRRRMRLALVASVLVLAGVVAGAAGWFNWQRNQANREAEALLELADNLQQRSRWQEARKALDQADRRLQGVGASELRGKVQQAHADLDWAARLDAIRLRRWTLAEGKVDSARASKEFAEVFQEAGFDVLDGELDTVAQRLKRSAIANVWIAALADWASALEKPELRVRFLNLIREAGDEALQKELDVALVVEDPVEITRLCAEGKTSPSIASLIAQRFKDLGFTPLELLRPVQHRHPTDFWLNLTVGTLLLQKEKQAIAEATGYLRAALGVRPESAVAHNNLGIALVAGNHPKEALVSFREAIRLEPNRAAWRYNLGVAYTQLVQEVEACEAYREAIRVEPTYAYAHYNLGILYRQGKDFPAAIEAFREALRLDPQLKEAQQNLALALSEIDKRDEAIALRRAAVVRNPNDARAHYSLGNSLRDAGKLDEALSAYRDSLRLNPEDAQVQNNLGVVLAEKGDLVNAVKAYGEALRLKPNEPELHYNLGTAQAAGEKWAEAIAALREALRLSPRNGRIHNNLGMALARLGKTDDALLAYTEAVRLTPEEALLHCNFGMALARKGQTYAALAAFKDAVRHRSDYGKAQYNLGVSLARLNRLTEAVSEYRKAFQNEPRYKSADFNRGPALASKQLLHEETAGYHVYRDPAEKSMSYQLGNVFATRDVVVDLTKDKLANLSYYEQLLNAEMANSSFTLRPIHPESARVDFIPGKTILAGGLVDDVLASYRDAIQFDPHEARALYNFANALTGSGEPNEAISVFSEALSFDPRYVPAHNNLGVARLRADKLKDAILSLREAIQLDRQFVPAHNNLGIALVRQGKPTESVNAFRAGISVAPKDALLHFNLGTVLVGEGKLEAALTAFETALQSSPMDAPAHCNRGVALVRKGETTQALAAYREAIRHDPLLAPAHSNLGAALTATGKLEEAVAACEQALKLDSKEARTHSNLAVALSEQGEQKKAIASGREAISLQPKMALAHYNLGVAYSRNLERADAKKAYEEAIRLNAKLAPAHNNLGVVLTEWGSFEEAVKAYREALRLKPREANVHYNLGVALSQKGETANAVAAYREAIRVDARLALAHCNLGIALAKQDRPKESLPALRKAVELDSKLALAHYNLGTRLMESGLFDEAATALQRAVEIDPTFAEAHCNLGLVLRDRGKLAEATKALEKGHALGREKSDWNYPSKLWAERCKRMTALEPDLAALLRGEKVLVEVVGRLALAELCLLPSQLRYVDAARIYAEIFTAEPSIASDLQTLVRYHAACAALQAAAGLGKEEVPLKETERGRLRNQAREWLQADLALWGKQQEEGNDAARNEARQILRGWELAPPLAGVRDPASLARIPESEQVLWKKFWTEVGERIRK